MHLHVLFPAPEHFFKNFSSTVCRKHVRKISDRTPSLRNW
jgi:hypothetical protein